MLRMRPAQDFKRAIMVCTVKLYPTEQEYKFTLRILIIKKFYEYP